MARRGTIDVHFHCLPGIDDGPEGDAAALELLRAARADDISVVVATPHVLRHPWLNEDPAARDALLDGLSAAVGGAPRLLPGCEYFFGLDAVELWEKGAAGPLVGLNRSRYLLTEFAPGHVPAGAEEVFHELAVLGAVPLIAHPERNLVFARSPGRLEALLKKGAAVQVTAGSLLGDFGSGARAYAKELMERGLVDVIASDAHSVERRPPRMAAAREYVRRVWGGEVEEGLFELNPAAVIADEALPWRGGR